MRNFHLNRNHQFCPTINLDKLWSLVGEEKRLECVKDPKKVPVVDIVQFVSKFIYFFLFFLKIFIKIKQKMMTIRTGGLNGAVHLHKIYVDSYFTDS